MPDPSQQLQRLVEAGFTLQTFERFPRSLELAVLTMAIAMIFFTAVFIVAPADAP